MSHSKISFGGTLQPLVDLLSRTPRQNGKLSGQEVVIERKGIQAIIALDAENDIHLLITPASANDSRLAELEFKGLKISAKEWVVADKPSQLYLDVSCSTGALPAFKRPFLRFAEDVLFEISESEMSPSDAVYRTGTRWKKFWSPDVGSDVSREWVYGIFGELLFLSDLMRRFGPTVVRNWTGPAGKDHDFQVSTDLAVEVKTSTETPFKINCNIRQLDDSLFKLLYIACYKVTPSENGIILPELVRRVESLIGSDDVLLDDFYSRLTAVGYELQSEPAYGAFRLEHSDAAVFQVDEEFPKIVGASFAGPLDQRISAVRFALQLTNLPELKIDDISSHLKSFAKE